MQGTLLWGFSDSNTEAQIVVASVLKMAGFGGLRVFEAYLYLSSLLTFKPTNHGVLVLRCNCYRVNK